MNRPTVRKRAKKRHVCPRRKDRVCIRKETMEAIRDALYAAYAMYHECKLGPCSVQFEGMRCGWEHLTGQKVQSRYNCPTGCIFGKMRAAAVKADWALFTMEGDK